MVDNINTVANLTSVIAPPVQPPSLVAALQAFITGSGVPNVPQALLQTPSGQQITAVVLAANPQGQVLLQTAQGQIAFNSPVQLNVGQQLALETLPRQALPQQVPGAPPPPLSAIPLDVKLVRVNGVPVEQAFPQAANSATSNPESAPRAPTQQQQNLAPITSGLYLRAVFPQAPQKSVQQSTTAAKSLFSNVAVELEPSPIQTGATFRAAVLNTPLQQPKKNNPELEDIAAALRDPNAPKLPDIKTGDVLTVKVTSGTLPLSVPSTTTEVPEENQAQIPLITTAFKEAAAPAAPREALAETALVVNTENPEAATVPAATSPEIGAETEVEITPAPAAPKTEIASANIPTLTGKVIAQEPDGSPIVQTPVATLRLPSDIPLPRGAQISLQIQNIEPALDLFAASQLPGSFQTGNLATDALIKGHTSLDTLFKQLFDLSPSSARETVREVIPQSGRQFGSKVLEFIRGVKEGTIPDTIRQILPKEITDQLKLSQTTQELSSLKAPLADAPQQQWSYMLVPVMQGEEMQHMRWYKRKQVAETGSDAPEGTRFVVELETKSLGHIQLDGLFFNQPKNKEFDLVIRSQKGFNEDEQEEISQIYNNYGEITGYKGSLRFEKTKVFSIQPLSDILSGQHREISV